MRQGLFTIAIMFLSCVSVGFAQVDTPPNAVPEQTDGKDYAGRPLAAHIEPRPSVPTQPTQVASR